MLIELVLVGVLQITAYQALPAQTRPETLDVNHCWTSVGDHCSEQGVAVSQDLLASGEVHYHDTIYIENVGFRIVNDTMAKRITRGVDVFVYDQNGEKRIGLQHQKVYVVKAVGGK